MENIRIGSTGPTVELVQLALSRAGADPGVLDGDFGPSTEDAVIRFQAKEGLVDDGIVGPRTWAQLTPYMTGYVEHQVKSGDTFYTLAKQYQTTMDAIATANPTIEAKHIPDGANLIIPLGFPLVPTNISFTSQVLRFVLEGLQARYPFIGSSVIGRSIMGRPLTALVIGKGRVSVGYNASHHANEWITTPVVLKYLEDYAKAYATGKKIGGVLAKDLYDNIRLVLVPMVNPDGVDLVTGFFKPDNYYFKQAQTMARNYPGIPFPSGWKANINGVDLNLSYPAGWANAREIKFEQGFTEPGPRDYVGVTPLSQPEVVAMFLFTLTQNFALTLSYHTQGEIIYWRYLDYLPKDSLAIAQEMGDASGYSVEETPAASGYAGYKDWFIQQYNRPGYTIEVGRGVSPLPLSQFDKIYNDNVPILTIGMTSMIPSAGTVLPPATATIPAPKEDLLSKYLTSQSLIEGAPPFQEEDMPPSAPLPKAAPTQTRFARWFR
ncbi:MAG: M14 family metallopeptidase [Angelakisella sp.]|nr:M14 family metallopeptidase [Angelakisella sp.]